MYPDVVVIGGGIVGCSCAYFLARQGLSVQLLERESIGAGTSKAGQCHVMCWELPEINVRLALASRKLYEELSETLPRDIEFRRTASLAMLDSPDSVAALAETIDRLRGLGLHSQLLSAEEFRAIEPNVSPDIAGGGYFPEDAQVNPMAATWALGQAAAHRGVAISVPVEVTGIELSPGGRRIVAVQTSTGKISTANVVVAAGAWSGALGKTVGVDIPVIPRKGHLVVTEPIADGMLKTKIILAAGYIDTLAAGGGVAVAANLQQVPHGSLVLGSSREFVGFDRTVNPEVVSALVERCLRFFPCLAGVHAIRSWAGLRPYSPDMLPIIGPVDHVEGLYVASGHEGIGITTGPITGKLIAQLITGQKPDVPIGELSLSRFADNGL